MKHIFSYMYMYSQLQIYNHISWFVCVRNSLSYGNIWQYNYIQKKLSILYNQVAYNEVCGYYKVSTQSHQLSI